MRTKPWFRAALVLIALGLIGWAVRSRFQGDARAAPPASSGAPGGDRVIPVLAAPVAQRDVPIYLDGLGTVTAFNTVMVKPQVDGRLVSVSFREGQEVHRGDVLAQIDPRPFQLQLHQAEAALARDRAQLRGDRQSLDRSIALRKEGLASQQQIDEQQAAVDRGEAVLRADQVQIENARLQLEYARVTAPIDGVTGVRQIDAGNIVRQSDPSGIVVITQIDPIAVLFTLPQDDLPRISKQLAEGPITVEARSRDGEAPLGKGELALIDNQINQATATIRLKAVFPNPGRTMWPNQFVKARLLLTTRKGARVIPAAAVQRGPQGSFVYVVGADQKAAPKPVQVESTQGDLAILAGGLEPGEQVVVDGQHLLRPGSRVAVKQEGGKPGAAEGGKPGAAK